MSFHHATFRLLGDELAFSSAAKKLLHETEHRLGIVLPESVRDWYERESAIQVLADHSNQDPPIDISEFALIQWKQRTLLPIRHENQGVCTWAVEISGLDDPAVLVDVDTQGAHWNALAERFSDYVWSCVWDYKIVFGQPFLVQAQNRGLTKPALDVLSRNLAPELKTHGWPGSTQHRFHSPRFGVLIWDSGEQADWFIGASDQNGLRAGLEAVWNIDSVGSSFYECSDTSRETLAEMRKRL